MRSPHPTRIVLTGGPGGGKTTAAHLFKCEIGEQITLVPETATLLYRGGFPRSNDEEGRRLIQTAIYQVQHYMEENHAGLYPSRVHLCDRGSPDGAAYWPKGYEDFFQVLHTTLEKEMNRYSAVLFFETAAAGGLSIGYGNHTRTESFEEAVEIDLRLRDLWSRHPNFLLVPHHTSFLQKMENGFQKFRMLLNTLGIQ